MTKTRFFCTITILLCPIVLLSLYVSSSSAQSLQSEVSEAIDSFVHVEMENNLVPGISIGIIENNEIVYLKGFGTANSENQVKPQTPFIIGSMSKAFTALAVMQLVEAGEIDLDIPIIQYLPGFKLADYEATQKITVRHLLNQTSGIPNTIGLLQCTGTGELTIEEAVEELSTVQPFSNAGDRFQYSNANYTVLGLLIETVSGKSYGEYVQEHIFELLDMTYSYTSETEADLNGLASGYRRWFGLNIASELPYLQHAIPSGYIISSAEDITHFLMAQLNGGNYKNISILSEEGINELHKPVAQSGNEYYGMGWVIGNSGGTPQIWHHGSTANYHSTMLMEPATNRGIVVLTNVGLFEVWDLGVSKVIAEGIANILRDQPQSSYGLSISTRYLVTDILISLLTALMIVFTCLLPRWRRQLSDHVPRNSLTTARRLILPIAIDLTWPLIILIAFPTLTHIPSWSFWLLYQPDLGYWLIAVASLTLCKAIIHIFLSRRTILSITNDLTRIKLTITALTVEIIFLAIFLLVMFLSAGPANFVIVLLTISLLLESITLPIKILRKQTEVASQSTITK
jgi:CubicO group peptidase (beta-lactamase class C family)